ncbi:hypothetical protein K438DRAFT_1818040 [Mycena galopus ATCC 62051]|nr:hypothetical protein K438DRAFT_1818040 [Mycena galopus ATCC 62051]
MSSFALGPLSNGAPEYQNQYTLVNEDGWLRLAAISRRVLALPPEILADIFFFCLPFHDDVSIFPHPKDAPLVLCAVCQRWRNIALTTPQLWSSISFDADRLLTSQSGALYLDFVRMWLSRARSAPLSLYWDTFVPSDTAHSLLEIVSGLSMRWQVIEFGWHVPSSVIPVDGNYPFLEKLYLFMNLPHHSTLSFLDAPRLHTVYIGEYKTEIRLPWPQLAFFHTDFILCEPCVDLLRHAWNLVDAHLQIPVEVSSSLPKAIFTLPKLRSLNLSGTFHWEGDHDQVVQTMPMAFLNCLKAPALQFLTLGFEGCNSSRCDISPFLSFVSQSAFQLHTLTLSLIPTTAEDLIECLTASPTVINLKLQISSHILDLNPVFAEFTGHREFLPKLESLHIVLPGAPTVDASLVASVLGWRAGVGLRVFRFAASSHSQLEDFFESVKSHPACSELEASGMDVYLGKRTFRDFFM